MELKQECIYALSVNDKIVHHFVCSADHLEELTEGFLLSNGYLEKDDITRIEISHDELLIRVEAKNCQSGWNLREVLLDAKNKKNVECSHMTFDEKSIAEQMHGYHTKGSHTAMCLSENRFYIDKDVSRHCALDKVIGQAKNEDFSKCILVTSGRISCEMVMRAKYLGIPAIATLKYPTETSAAFAACMGIQCIEI